MFNIFKKIKPTYEITLNQVHDTVKVNEGGESITLKVCADPFKMVSGLSKAQKKLKEFSEIENPDEEEMKDTAEYFAAVIFGPEQARGLMDFYANDPACVINVCSTYFRERLAGRISDVQKKLNV